MPRIRSERITASGRACNKSRRWFAPALLAAILVYLWPVTWWLGPGHWSAAAAIAAALLLTVGYNRRYSNGPAEWGLSWPDLIPGLRWSIYLTTPALILIVYWGWAGRTLVGRREPAWDLAALFLWGLAQQFVLQTVVFREARRAAGRYAAITGAAAVFALMHLPNPFLVAATFAGGWAWCWIYERHPNLLPLALSHALVSLMILSCLPRAVTGGMRVGYSWFLLP